MSNQWFRSWHGAPTDPKWLGIARKAGVAPGIVAALVWALLDRASQATERGSIAGYDADGLACFMGCETDEVEAVIALMHDKGILTGDTFTGWEKHQPKREDNSADRVKEHRERKKAQCNADVTQCNATQRAETLDTDTDTDTEVEEREEAREALAPSVAVIPKTDPDADLAFNAYNDLAEEVGLAKAQVLTTTRRKKIAARLNECGGLRGWIDALAKIRGSPFLRGDNDRGWRADMDFILQASSFTRLMEGAYDRQPERQRPSSGKQRVSASDGFAILDAITDEAIRRADGCSQDSR